MAQFNFMVKFHGDKDWQDISEDMASHLLKVYYPDDEIPEKIRDIKCGHPLTTVSATIEAWSNVGETDMEDMKLLLNNECINCEIGARCWLISDQIILQQHIKNGLFDDYVCKIRAAMEHALLHSGNPAIFFHRYDFLC